MTIKKFEIFSYSFIAMPIAFASVPIYIFLPDYYYTSYGVDLTALSIILFSLRILDAIFDPIIGWYCDRFYKLNKVSFIIIIICFILGMYITCSPIFSNKVVNLFIGVFLATLAFSYTTIFIYTRGALWLDNDESRSLVISVREVFNIIGVLIASILPFVFLLYFPQKQSYLIYSVIAIFLIIVASIFFLNWLDKVNIDKKVTDHIKIYDYFKAFDKNSLFLFLAYSLSALGSAIPAVTLVFFSRYVLETTDFTGLYIFLYFLGAILFIPLVRKIAIKIGIIKTWSYALIFCVIVFIFAFFLKSGDIFYFSIISFLSGGGFASELILPNILLAKWIDNPKRRELGNGYYAILAFIGKFCFALATIIALPILNTQINSSSTSNLEVTIKIVYCVFPCIAKFSAAIVLLLWYKKAFKNL
ncbi:MFS transporter [Pseudofrancisella aestuarii]|uniref:MFS transporter n=1 Tax=Pseudofrancisella aestuarii TaxID=2670347 RepID=A0ABV9TDV6_9GAMM|nr:MFS transporter [Pseudofrancisella aestuarii]